jgi:restriction system protein
VAVPDFQAFMLPVLREFADGREHLYKDVRERVAATLHLSPADISERIPSGKKTRVDDRASWAHVYLKQAGLLSSARRGVYQITARGQQVLASAPEKINMEFLERFPEYLEFKSRRRLTNGDAQATATPRAIDHVPQTALTPDEQIRAGYELLRATLAEQLLERVRQASPAFFEQLVVDVLVAMGYGGSQEDAARVVGQSGDGGIDGIIKEDRLGLESIYVQAKRWEDTTVGRPAIQQFAGALQGHRARKGVFITTSTFSRDAIDYAKGLQTTIVLIDGVQLADFMIEFGVGVTDVETIMLKRLDEDYFGTE